MRIDISDILDLLLVKAESCFLSKSRMRVAGIIKPSSTIGYALREHVQNRDGVLERTLRRVILEELRVLNK